MTRVRDAVERARQRAGERYTPEIVAQLERAAREVEHLGGSLVDALAEDRLALIVEPRRDPTGRRPQRDRSEIVQLVADCETGGAAAVSVVTDPTIARGSYDDLRLAREATLLPLIARDFVVHPGNVYELRALGADAILVAMAAFDDIDESATITQPGELVERARDVGLEIVLSVRSEQQLEAALELEADAYNLDNRSGNGRIDIDLTLELLTQVPVGNPILSESVARLEEVEQLQRAGVDGLLLDEGHLETGLRPALELFRSLVLPD